MLVFSLSVSCNVFVTMQQRSTFQTKYS